MSLREFLTHNFWLKCFSLALATLVWFTVHFQVTQGKNPAEAPEETYRNLRVTVLSDPADTRVFQVTPSEVSVTVTGPSGLLRHLSGRDFQVFVNLIDPEQTHSMVRKVEVLCPRGITEYQVDPPVVQVEQVRETAQHTPSSPP